MAMEMMTTNSVGTAEWLSVSNNMTVSAYIGSQPLILTPGEVADFTGSQIEVAELTNLDRRRISRAYRAPRSRQSPNPHSDIDPFAP